MWGVLTSESCSLSGCPIYDSPTPHATAMPWTQNIGKRKGGHLESGPDFGIKEHLSMPGVVVVGNSSSSRDHAEQGCFCARFPGHALSPEGRRRVADSYLMAPSFSYSSRILFSDSSSLLVLFFLLREQVSLKLRRENEQNDRRDTLLGPRGD